MSDLKQDAEDIKVTSFLYLVIGIVAVTWVLFSCSPSTPASKPVSEPTTWEVILYCPDCADIGMKINLWKTPSREGLQTTGKIEHGTTCTVIDKDTYDGVVHYKVKCPGGTGWVSKEMVK